MNFIISFALILLPIVCLSNQSEPYIEDIQLMEPLTDDYQPLYLPKADAGTTQFLVLTASLKEVSEGLSYQENLALIDGGRWKHRLTIWGSGRALQIWHRIVSNDSEDGVIKMTGKYKIGANLKLVELPKAFFVDFPLGHQMPTPSYLDLKLNGTPPFFIVAATNSTIDSSKALFSYGNPRNYIYLSPLEAFGDSSIGETTGVAASFSLVNAEN